MNTTWLATFFTKQREIIEAAETPFAKLAVFILPIMAPTIPATLTGVHMHQLLLELFKFEFGVEISTILSVMIGITLEILGYVGAVSAIKSLFDYVRTRQPEYLLPFILNGSAYVFYLIAVYAINVALGTYFHTPALANTIIGLLSFITVPSSLLAANHLNDTAETERQIRERDESYQRASIEREKDRKFQLEKLKLRQKSGNLSKRSKKLSKQSGKFPDGFYKLSGNWRRDKGNLSKPDLQRLASLEPDDMKVLALELEVTYKTVSNWRANAQSELGIKNPLTY